MVGGICFLVFVCGLLLLSSFSHAGEVEPQHVDFTNFVIILLMVVTIVMTFLTIALAALAFFGFGQIQKSSEAAAAKAVRELLRDGGEVGEVLISNLTDQDHPLHQALSGEIARQILEGKGLYGE